MLFLCIRNEINTQKMITVSDLTLESTLEAQWKSY